MSPVFGSAGGYLAAAFAIAGLAGCMETQLGAHMVKSVARTAQSEPGPGALTPAEAAALDPETFTATDVTVWDGVTTLEGVWIAHPLATKPQRVLLRNAENGREVESAMFRRSPDMPGPTIIVSSDAAHALGLTAGATTEISVTALRAPPETAVASAAPRPAPAEISASPLAPAPAAVPVSYTTEAHTAAAPLPERPEPLVRPPSRALPTPVERPESAGPALSKETFLQVGVFRDEKNAVALTDRFLARGQPARHTQAAGNSALTVVLIGPLAPGAIAGARAAAADEGVADAIEVKL